MMAERGGYKNAKSAREGFRYVKKKFLAVVGIDPNTGLPKESAPSAAATSTTGTPSRIAPARAAYFKAASATTPLPQVKPTRASSTRTVPAKRGIQGATASPLPKEEEEFDSKDIDDVVDSDDEEDDKPPRARYPPTKKIKTSVESKVPKDDLNDVAPPDQLDENDHHGCDEAAAHDNKPEEESNTVVTNPRVDPKEQDSMEDENADEDAHDLDEKSKDAGDVAMTENFDSQKNVETMSITGKPETETAQAHQGADHQIESTCQETDKTTGETKEEAVAGADQGVNDTDTAAVLTFDSETQGVPVEP